MSRTYPPLRDRLYARLIIDQETGCLLWTGPRNRKGYGVIGKKIGLRNRQLKVHRVAYELANGPIPEGLVIDHLCRVRNCANPAHLEAVTHAENILRGDGVAAANAAKTHCAKGHKYGISTSGKRYCPECKRASDRKVTK